MLVSQEATLSNCGKILSGPHHRGSPKGVVQHQANNLGYGNSMWSRENLQPSPFGGAVHRPNGSGHNSA
jgi:hypothetical protein